MSVLNFTLENTIAALLAAKRYAALRDVFVTMQAADIAALFANLDEATLPLLFRLLPKELAADTFVEMDSDAQELLITGFSDSELKEVVDELYIDDAVDIVEEMPANVVKRILAQADPQKRAEINELLKYPESSAGSIMTTEFVELKPTLLVSEAIKSIKRSGVNKETINDCYVIKDDRTLCGMLPIRALILADDDETLEGVMDRGVISVTTTDDQETVAQMFSKYDLLALPVVDAEGRLVGIITVDDAIDVLTEETTEDIEKMAAITPSDKPYLKTGVFSLYIHRIPWLLLLMISATFTGLIITSFENALSACVALTAYIPMLMDTGGNSGSQASVTVIRGLSLGEIRFGDIFRVVFKEFRVSLLCGGTLAAFNFAKLMLLDRVSLTVSLVVCLTLFVTVFCAKLIGCILPMLAKKLGFDPVVMASPFITTLVDAVSLLTYFAIASALLGI